MRLTIWFLVLQLGGNLYYLKVLYLKSICSWNTSLYIRIFRYMYAYIYTYTYISMYTYICLLWKGTLPSRSLIYVKYYSAIQHRYCFKVNRTYYFFLLFIFCICMGYLYISMFMWLGLLNIRDMALFC